MTITNCLFLGQPGETLHASVNPYGGYSSSVTGAIASDGSGQVGLPVPADGPVNHPYHLLVSCQLGDQILLAGELDFTVEGLPRPTTAATPAAGPAGSSVAITGTNCLDGNQVLDHTEIVIEGPDGPTGPAVTAPVQSDGTWSSETTFPAVTGSYTVRATCSLGGFALQSTASLTTSSPDPSTSATTMPPSASPMDTAPRAVAVAGSPSFAG